MYVTVMTLSALLFINGSSLTLTNVTVVNAVSAGIYLVDYVTIYPYDKVKVVTSKVVKTMYLKLFQPYMVVST